MIRYRWRVVDEERVCRVYSTKGVEELEAWTRRRGLPVEWIDRAYGGLATLTLTGRNLRLGGRGVDTRTYMEDAQAAVRRRDAPFWARVAYDATRRPFVRPGAKLEVRA